MYNWNTNTSKLEQNPKKSAVWKLEQSINFGLNGVKLKAKEIKKYWNQLSLDPQRKKLLEMWLGLSK